MNYNDTLLNMGIMPIEHEPDRQDTQCKKS